MTLHSLAELRRLLKPGFKLKLIDTNLSGHKALNTTRTIEHAQTNAIRFEGGSWLYTGGDMAKSKDFTFYDGGFIIDTSYREDYPIMLNYQYIN